MAGRLRSALCHLRACPWAAGALVCGEMEDPRPLPQHPWLWGDWGPQSCSWHPWVLPWAFGGGQGAVRQHGPGSSPRTGCFGLGVCGGVGVPQMWQRGDPRRDGD